MVAGPHASTLAVAVAATLRGAVASDKAKVAAAVVRLHARAIHAALGAHWAAQPRDTAGTGRGQGRAVAEPTLTILTPAVPSLSSVRACPQPLFLGYPVKFITLPSTAYPPGSILPPSRLGPFSFTLLRSMLHPLLLLTLSYSSLSRPSPLDPTQAGCSLTCP